MRWRVWFLRVATIFFLTILPAANVLASTVGDVTLFVTPLFTGGITSFTITYVSETQLRLDWTVGAAVTNVMIRAKYGQYPADITSNATAPSDGYLVYYGSALSANDTSMDFDANPGPIYYRAWAQVGTSWTLTPAEGWKESAILTLLAMIAIPAIFSFLGFKNTQMRMIAGFAWFIPLIYWIYNRPSSITAGTPPDIFPILIFVGAALIMFFWPFLSNGNNNARFRVSIDRVFGREDSGPRTSARDAYRNRAASYRASVNRALGREE